MQLRSFFVPVQQVLIRRRSLRYLLQVSLLTLLYIGAAKFGLAFAFIENHISPLAPPIGVAVATLLLFGYRLWPGVLLGALLANVVLPVAPLAALPIAIGRTLEALLAVYLLKHLVQYRPAIDRLRDVGGLIGIGAVLCPLVGATIGVISLWAVGDLQAGSIGEAWLIWWSSDALGILIVVPLLTLVGDRDRARLSRQQQIEACLVISLLAIVSGMIFQHRPSHTYFIFPFVIWATLRFEQRGAAIALFLVASIAAWNTANSAGPFAHASFAESLFFLQLFIAVLAITALIFGALTAQRKQAEEALHTSDQALKDANSRLTAIFENAPAVAIQVYDSSGRATFWNKASEQLFGWSAEAMLGRALRGSVLSEHDGHEFEQLVQRLLITNQPAPVREWSTIAADGNERYVMSSIFPIGVEPAARQIVCMDIDVTERRELEGRLLQSQKMESIGRLAGGVAHDFNNLLTAISGYTDLVIGEIEPGNPIHSDLQQIQQATKRAANLTRQLLTFARKQVIEPHNLDLNELILHTSKLLQRLIGEDIQLVTQLASGLRTIKADPHQIEQVLVNLAVNARDAMPSGGTLLIKTHNTRLDHALPHTQGTVAAGDYVTLTIADTGVGMSEAIKPHLFEPFFTTKAPGKGTGLGLATCYGIIKQHSGAIWLSSELGVGTSAIIHLPASAGAPEPSGQNDRLEVLAHGSETILLVEDEPAVRSLAARVLGSHGYQVLEAANGIEALQLAQSHATPIDLLLSDVVMPQLGGKRLAQRLRASDPNLRIIFMSGYIDAMLDADTPAPAGAVLLQKPFTADALIAKIQEVLKR